MRSGTSAFESSVNANASSKVIGSSLFNSLSDNVSSKEIIVLLKTS